MIATVDGFATKGRRYMQARRIGSLFKIYCCAVPSFALDLGPFLGILSYKVVSDIRRVMVIRLTMLTM